MKKKLIQFLMLSVIAVSIGAFVSCKDTNEDLINELRDEIGADDLSGRTLGERLAELESQLAAMKSCACDPNIPSYVSDLQTTVAKLQADLLALGLKVNDDGTIDIGGASIGGGGSTGAGGFTLDDLLGDLSGIMDEEGFTTDLATIIQNVTNNSTAITNIQNTLTDYWAEIEKLLAAKEAADKKFGELDEFLDALQKKVDACEQTCKSEFEKVWTKVNLLETGLTQAKAKADAAYELAEKIEKDYKEAVAAVQKIAEDAADAAEAANKAAKEAAELAQQAKDDAANAQISADAANTLAQTANDNALNAIKLANDALALESRIANNEAAIAALDKRVKDNETNIETLNGHITRINGILTDYETRISKNTTDIQTNAQAIEDIKKELDEIKKYAEDIEQNAKAIAELKETVETLDKTLNDKISGVSATASEALTKAIKAAEQADINKQYIENLEKRVKANEDAIELLQKAKEELEKTVGELDTAVKQNASDIKSLQDNVTTIQGNVTTMGKDIATMKTDIADLKKKVEDIEKDLAQVKEDCAKNLQEAKNYTDTEIAAAKVAIMAAVTKELEKYYTKEEIDAMLKDVDDNIQKLKIELMEDYTLKITTLEETLTVKLNNLEESLNNLGATVGDHEGRIKTLEDLVKEITSCTCDEEAMQKSIELLKTMLNNIRDDIEANDELYKQLIQGNTDAIDAINKKIEDELNKRIEELATSVDGLTTNFNKLKDIIYKNYATKAYVDEITNAIIDEITGVKEDVQNNSDRIDENSAKIDDLIDNFAEHLADYAALEARVASLQSVVTIFEDELDEIKEQLGDKVDIEDYEEDISNIMDLIQANATDISDLQDAVEGINEDIATLKEEQNKLKDRMHVAEEALKALEDKIDTEINEVKEKIAEIQNNLAKQVTSINLQAATNPWFGMISTPFGMQSNFVIALYGTPMSEVVFPAPQYAGGNYVRASESLTAKDMQMIGNVSETFDAGWPIMFKYDKDEDYAYAGKIYMTINPNTANLDGLKMSIVNTADEESPITLSPITKSEEKLQFGWTRADNGFYEAEAIVDGLGVEKINSPKFNTAAIKDAAENVRDMIAQIAKTSSIDGNGNRFEKIATDINNIVRDLKFDRSGLKVTYTTEETDANGIKQEKEHSVYSEYNLAATAFQPLGLETLKDLNVQTIPGYEKVEALIDRVADELNNKVHIFFKDFNDSELLKKVQGLKAKIKNVEIADLTKDQLALFKVDIDTTIYIDDLKYQLDLHETAKVPVKFTADVTVPVDIDQDISIDLSQVTVNTPTISITTDIKNKNGTATLIVPVKDGDNTVGQATVDLTQIDVKADATLGVITLNGTTVAHLTYKDDVTASISVDEEVEATIDITKLIYFGNCKLAKDAEGNVLRDEKGKPIVYVDPDGKNDAKGVRVWFTKDLSDAAISLWGSAQSALSDVNEMMEALRDIIDELNKTIDQINSYETQFNNTVNGYREKLQGYLQKINGAITSVINSANSRLQPFMVANSRSKGMKRLSGAKNYPTRMSSDMSLYATSQTMELFVPFARKHTAVTNVFSADLSKNVQDGTLDKSILTSVKGDNLNKVLNGTECEIKLNGLKPGYVYEIAYSALDFKGKMATRKYYITLE